MHLLVSRYNKFRNFAEKLLVPSLKKSSASKNLKVMAWDDYRSGAFQAAQEVYGNDSAKSSVIDGLAVVYAICSSIIKL